MHIFMHNRFGELSWDELKRRRTLKERELDFADAGRVFASAKVEFPDERADYGEPRFVTVGELEGRLMVVVWTPRDGGRRIISMRKANEREEARYQVLEG